MDGSVIAIVFLFCLVSGQQAAGEATLRGQWGRGECEKLLVIATSQQLFIVSVTTEEYCDNEVFDASCNAGEFITILAAEYGQMHLGKCIKNDFGHVGCKADAATIVGNTCNGKQNCEFDESQLGSLSPCPSGLAVFLEVTHSCLKGESYFPNIHSSNLCLILQR
jgi:hypothetical protein